VIVSLLMQAPGKQVLAVVVLEFVFVGQVAVASIETLGQEQETTDPVPIFFKVAGVPKFIGFRLPAATAGKLPPSKTRAEQQGFCWNGRRREEGDMNVERISAITIKVSDMAKSVHFYNKLLGLKILYGGQAAYFASLQTLSAKDTILNLEQGHVTRDWGRIIFYVGDVDKFWAYLKEKEFNPDRPRDAEWGERYFHLHDPDGHELSFAQPVA